MSPHRSFRVLVCCAVLMMAATQTAVASQKDPSGSASAGKKLPGKVTFREAPSAEKPAERTKRLKRECKGRPNAGMCLGHAS